MKRDDLNRWLWAHTLLISFGSGLLGLAIGAFVLSDPIADAWLYRWQTLIAGTAALAGAWLTVSAMRRQGQMQYLQHELAIADAALREAAERDMSLQIIESAIEYTLNQVEKPPDLSNEDAVRAFAANVGGVNGRYAFTSNIEEVHKFHRGNIKQIADHLGALIKAAQSRHDRFQHERDVTEELLTYVQPYVSRWVVEARVTCEKLRNRRDDLQTQLKELV